MMEHFESTRIKFYANVKEWMDEEGGGEFRPKQK